MQLLILKMCALVASGVLVAMFLAIWSTRRGSMDSTLYKPGFATELVWAAIPCLIMVAAAIPAVVGIVSARDMR